MPKHTNPYAKSRLALHIDECIRKLAGRKRQKDIAREAGFRSANMLSMLKNGDSKLPLDRVPDLAAALETDPRLLLGMALEQDGLETTNSAIRAILGLVVTTNEIAWIEELRDASGRADPPLTARARKTLRGLFE